MHSKKIRSIGRPEIRKPKSQINCGTKEQMKIFFRRCWVESPLEAFSGSLKTALKRRRYNDRIFNWSLPPLKLKKSSGSTQLKIGAAVVAQRWSTCLRSRALEAEGSNPTGCWAFFLLLLSISSLSLPAFLHQWSVLNQVPQKEVHL